MGSVWAQFQCKSIWIKFVVYRIIININNKLFLLHNICIIIANCYYMLNIIYEIFKN